MKRIHWRTRQRIIREYEADTQIVIRRGFLDFVKMTIAQARFYNALAVGKEALTGPVCFDLGTNPSSEGAAPSLSKSHTSDKPSNTPGSNPGE